MNGEVPVPCRSVHGSGSRLQFGWYVIVRAAAFLRLHPVADGDVSLAVDTAVCLRRGMASIIEHLSRPIAEFVSTGRTS